MAWPDEYPSQTVNVQIKRPHRSTDQTPTAWTDAWDDSNLQLVKASLPVAGHDGAGMAVLTQPGADAEAEAGIMGGPRLNMDSSSHGLVENDTVTAYWDTRAKSRTGAHVEAVDGTDVELQGGSGDDWPATATNMIVARGSAGWHGPWTDQFNIIQLANATGLSAGMVVTCTWVDGTTQIRTGVTISTKVDNNVFVNRATGQGDPWPGHNVADMVLTIEATGAMDGRRVYAVGTPTIDSGIVTVKWDGGGSIRTGVSIVEFEDGSGWILADGSGDAFPAEDTAVQLLPVADLDLCGYYVRLRLPKLDADGQVIPDEYDPFWYGVIERQNGAATEFYAYDWTWWIQQKMGVAYSIHHLGDTAIYADAAALRADCAKVGVLHSFNIVDGYGEVERGNRFTPTGKTFHAFGGEDVWSRTQALAYVVDWLMTRWKNSGGWSVDHNYPEFFLDGTAAGTVNGQSVPAVLDSLDNIKGTMNLQGVRTVGDILRRILPVHLGYDWRVVPVETNGVVSLKIYVFSVAAATTSFGASGSEATLPGNADVVADLVNGTDHVAASDITASRVMRSTNQLYECVRMNGRPIIVQFSLAGDHAIGLTMSTILDTLKAHWDTGDAQSLYLAPPITSEPPPTADDYDQYRRSQVFDEVFTLYGPSLTHQVGGTAVSGWDHAGGCAAPQLNQYGRVTTAFRDGPASNHGEYQTHVKRILPWTAIRSHGGYSTTGTPLDPLPHGQIRDLLPVTAWVYSPQHAGYVPVEHLGFAVYASLTGLSVYIKSIPNHRMAQTEWADDPGASDSRYQPDLDWRTMVVTMAMEFDQRLSCWSLVPGVTEPMTTKIIDLDSEHIAAECWYVAPDTVLGIDENGDFVKVATPSAGQANTYHLLRDDSAQIWPLMCGAIARYQRPRMPGYLQVKGLRPWAVDTLGHVLTKAGAIVVGAPITCIEWVASGQYMILRTDYYTDPVIR